MHSWLSLLCGLVVSAYVLLWLRLRRTRAMLTGLPSYPQLPFVGNLLQVIGDGRSLFRLLDDTSRRADEANKPFQIWYGPFPVIVLIDSDDAKAVTNAFIEKPYYYKFGKVWLGHGLVTAPGSIWKQNVKRLSNTFNKSVVEGYQMVFNAQAQKLVQKLRTLAGKDPVDIMHELAYTTLESICQTALGTDGICESVVSRQYYDAFNRCMTLLIRRGLNPLLHPDSIYRLTPHYKEMMENLAVVHNVSRTVLEKRKLERKKTKRTTTSDAGSENKFQAVLDILLNLSESDPQLSEEQIQNEVDTIILGGQETTASTLFFSLLMLGCRPTVQEKLYHELEYIFQGSSRPVEKTDLSRMEYCEAVIQETLRLFPPLPGVMRYADKDLQLKSCVVPKGTVCAISAWGAGRSRRSWGPDALDFDPDRWLDGRASNNPAAFLPFSYGRRSCIGKKYAMSILKTMLAYCVRELHFTSEADKMEFKVDVALRPTSGHLIQVKLRN